MRIDRRGRAGTLALALALALTAIFVLSPDRADACPGCQNPNLPMARASGVFLPPGQLRVGASLSGTGIEVVHEAGCVDVAECDAIPVQPYHFHNQTIVPIELRASLEWGLTEHFGVEASVPVRLVYTDADYTDAAGAPYSPIEGDIHHRTETLIGVGDPTLALRGAWTFLDAWWILRVGTSLPAGKTEPDPFKAGDALEEHQHVQFGTGTFDPLVGAEVARSFGRLQAAVYGQLQLPLYENSHGFKAGTRGLGGLQLGYRPLERLLLQSSLEYLRDGSETWSGEVQQDGILGREEVLLGLGTVFSLGGPQYSGAIRVPVYRNIFQGANTEAGELKSPVSISLGVQWTI